MDYRLLPRVLDETGQDTAASSWNTFLLMQSIEGAQVIPYEKFPTMVSYMMYAANHVSCEEVNGRPAFIAPPIWERCFHTQFTPGEPIGEGGFGHVSTMASDESLCIKYVPKLTALFKEAVIMDIVHLTSLFKPHGASNKVLQMMFACIDCQCIVLPKMRCSLDNYPEWSPNSVVDTLIGFRGLIDGLLFLNFTCGITHCDVSPSNILVGAAGLSDLVLSDLGIATIICNHGMPGEIPIFSKTLGRVTSLYSSSCPMFFAKREYRPSTCLFICYKAIKEQKNPESVPMYWRTPQEGLRLDLCSLYYSFQDSLLCMAGFPQRRLDVLKVSPPPPDRAGKYLAYMMQRTVVTHFMCEVWGLSVETGLDIDGGSSNIHIPRTHRSYFKAVAEKALCLVRQQFTPDKRITILSESVQAFIVPFLRLDSFNHCHGKVDYSGFFC
uniref:Tegument serine/threonine protein kinase n=1 Tax=Wood mouse herpesvirus TaxID=432370 RepID=D0PPC5_9GAMA|nr:tegument serine/threonine protein kinase [Wood mouse herpesvirus]